MGNKIFLIIVLIWSSTLWSKDINEVPLIKQAVAKKIVDDLYHEIISTWSVEIDGENSNILYLNSPVQRVNNSNSYCFQNSIEIHKDELERVILTTDLFFGFDLHEKYSLNLNDLPCEKVLRSSMFRIFSLNGNGANIGLLNMLKEISEKPWLNKTNKKYKIAYQNDEAKLCLAKNNGALNLLSIKEKIDGVRDVDILKESMGSETLIF